MTSSPNGIVALVGAGEFLPTMASVDKMLLERLGTPPHVVVLPTAAVPDGPVVVERWAHMGIEHFGQLGATVEAVMLNNRADADNPDIVAQLTDANFIYFSGGKPSYLLETIQDTASWQAIMGVFATGGVIAGCSAGAMVLGAELFDFPQVWRTTPALGLVPGIAVIPHFDEIPKLLTGTIARAREKLTVVGIDGATALVGNPGLAQAQWTVFGRGGITIITKHKKRRYSAGEQVSFP